MTPHTKAPTALRSAIYVGTTVHSRYKPLYNRFEYSVFMLLIDLEEMRQGHLERWPVLSSRIRASLMNFRVEDHKSIADTGEGERCVADRLEARIHVLVEKETGMITRGRVALLTSVRMFGFGFNPVSFYYVYDEHGDTVVAVVAEVANIPWLEQHTYVALPDRPLQRNSPHRTTFRVQAKEFHVSPFMPIDKIDYDWSFNRPEETIQVGIALSQRAAQEHTSAESMAKSTFFHASLGLHRLDFGVMSLLQCLLLQPLYSMKVVLAIHYEAFKLWRRGLVLHPHPTGAENGLSRAIEILSGVVVSLTRTAKYWLTRIQSKQYRTRLNIN